MGVFGSKSPLRLVGGHFLGCLGMEKVHALQSALLALADVDCRLHFSPFSDGNKNLECAFCDGVK
jgi:hypothetical protein